VEAFSVRYYRTRDGMFCGRVMNSDGDLVALHYGDGAGWFKREDLIPMSCAEAVNWRVPQ
jgi:hypothetical protein